eukprot:273010-Chlamydomonas_euryale.AAC.1
MMSVTCQVRRADVQVSRRSSRGRHPLHMRVLGSVQAAWSAHHHHLKVAHLTTRNCETFSRLHARLRPSTGCMPG